MESAANLVGERGSGGTPVEPCAKGTGEADRGVEAGIGVLAGSAMAHSGVWESRLVVDERGLS